MAALPLGGGRQVSSCETLFQGGVGMRGARDSEHLLRTSPHIPHVLKTR